MMRVDPTTARDLGVAGLREALDRTRTRAGSEAFRRRLAEPFEDAESIRAVQEALAALASLPSPVRMDDRVLEGALHYLDSRVVLARGSRLRAWAAQGWYHVRYTDVLRELSKGRQTIRLLRSTARAVAERLDECPDSSLLADLAARLRDGTRALGTALSARPLLWADRRLRGEGRDVCRDVVEALADVDALQSMALVGGTSGWSRPTILDGGEVRLEVDGAVHPLLPSATPNPIRIGGDERLTFLTGPNMAGKTTYLRTVGLVVYLAQVGMNVPAERARVAPFAALFSSLNPVDDLSGGVSYFYAEVLRVRDAAALVAEGRPTLVLFDEVFRGTNLKDALEASSEVIRGFAEAPRAASIFSSHLSELSQALDDLPTVRFRRFSGTVEQGRPVFDFRIEEGVSDQRFGMLLLRDAGVPDLIARIQE